MSDEMLAAIDLLTLELSYVTDGEGEPIEDEAIIHFREDVDGTCEIRISSPGAHTIAAKIVETWNARTVGAAQVSMMPISQDAATIAQTAHVIINRLTEENERLRAAQASVMQGRMPTKSAMRTALGFMRSSAERNDNDARFVSGAGEAAEIYSDAAKCIAFALSVLAPNPMVPWELDCQREVCAAPECECPPVSSTHQREGK